MPDSTSSSRRRPTTRKKEQDTVIADMGRLQPQATELEQAVIGACLVETEAFGRISDLLRPEAFYEKRNREIFTAIQSLAAEDQPIDVYTVVEQLRKTARLDDAGGMGYVAELSEKMLSSAHIEYHARIIAQKSLARKLITYTSEIQEGAFDEGTDVAELMQKAEGELFELSKNSIRKDFTQINPVLKDAFAQLREASERKDGLSGLSSGFGALDKMTNGWQKSDLVIIAARPAMGKTAFVLSMARNIAVTNRVPVAIFSLEMANVQLVNRLIVNVCEIKGEKIKSGQLAPHEWAQLDLKSKELLDAPLYVDDTAQLSVFELRTKARRLKKEHDIQLIIIDYLQLMNASGMNYNSRQEEVSIISRSLKGLAKELNIPIIALSQLNRSVENRVGIDPENPDSKRPQLSDLRESGSIEQDADMVCFIHRPEYYKIYKDQYGNDLRGKGFIIIAKHRNGEVGDVTLKFEGEYIRFSDVNDTDDAPLPLPPGESSGSGVVYPSRANQPMLDPNDPFNSFTADMAPGDDVPY
jgi:replicative DNA helicase